MALEGSLWRRAGFAAKVIEQAKLPDSTRQVLLRADAEIFHFEKIPPRSRKVA
jgi:hypothetical protein